MPHKHTETYENTNPEPLLGEPKLALLSCPAMVARYYYYSFDGYIFIIQL